MRKIFLYLFFVFTVMYLFVGTYGLRNNKGYDTKYNTRADSTKPKTYAATDDFDDDTPSRKGLGLSAWGIVTVVVSLILAIAGMYYFSICYPVLCKKNKKYDIMGLTPA